MHIYEKTYNEMAGVYLAFESPAMNESPKNFGISHLLEHMICEATDDMEETYDENCVNTNAYTGKGEVVFHMTGLSDRVGMFRDDYVKRILSYEPTEKHFLKQKPIVTQELNDWFDDSFKSTYTNYLSKYHGFVTSIGTRESLESITFEDVVEFKKNYFSSPSKIIVADKSDFDIDCPVAPKIPKEINLHQNVNKDSEINLKSLGMIGGSAPISENRDDYNLRMIVKMLGYGLKSPLYQRLREQESLCYWVYCFEQYIHNQNTVLICTSASMENYQRIQDGIFEVLYNPERYLTKERFNLMLNNTHALISVREQYRHGMDYLGFHFDKESISIKKNLDRINYDGVMDYYMKHLHPSKRNWTFTNQKELYE